MGQTAWTKDIVRGRAGLPVDLQTAEHGDVVTRRNESATAIFPGLFVAKGTGDDQVIPPTAAADVVGLAVDMNARERIRGSVATDGYVQNSILPVAKNYRWYVVSEEAVSPSDTVYVRVAAGAGGTVLGAVRNDADTASAEALTGAKFVETTTAAGIVAVEISL